MINNPLTKTLSFAAVHFTVAFMVAYLLTGSFIVGGLLALVEPMCNTVAYHLHEKAWARIHRRRDGPEALARLFAGATVTLEWTPGLAP
ncbi:MAG: DUF2061 domain-containing protein [Tabrizicola sp.]|nr:DUF2061 domain-containing protein [Tabrizicola sp.]